MSFIRVRLPCPGSGEPVNGVAHTCGLDGQNCAVALHRTGSDQIVNNVVNTVSPGGPCDEDSPPRTGSDKPSTVLLVHHHLGPVILMRTVTFLRVLLHYSRPVRIR